MRLRQRQDLGIGYVEWDEVTRVRVGGRMLPREAFVVMPSTDAQPALRMTLAVVKGVPQCRELVIDSADGRREVRTMDLRAVTLETFVEQIFAVISNAIVAEGADHVTSVARLMSDREVRQAAKEIQHARSYGRRRMTDGLLEEVAQVYRDHEDDRPAQAVATAFAVKERTAGNYIRAARDAGKLPEPGKRKH